MSRLDDAKAALERDGHECPGPHCTTMVPRQQLACARHWKQVSPKAAREVYAAYRSGDTGRHYDAMAAAIAEMKP